jgi:glycosyltransferase involved in cell wall biosynthesis
VDSEDQILGFFIDWIKEFAKDCEKVSVVCLKKGKYDLPANVSVYSLGKENGRSRVKYILNFFKLIFSLKDEYDSVFVHMNYVYVLLGGLFWKMLNKKVALWYVHRQKSFGLWLSQPFVNEIFTSSPESFGYKSKKVVYVGHGVDSNKFSCESKELKNDKLKIVHIGRITPIKNLETLILATELLRKKIGSVSVEFVGGPVTSADNKYFEQLKGIVKNMRLEDAVTFRGPVQSAEIGRVYCEADITVNMAPTGGWDKTVIESIMAKRPVFASNLGLKPIFGDYWENFHFGQGNPLDLAKKVELFLAEGNTETILDDLRTHAVKEYGLNNLIQRVTDKLAS